MSNRIETDNEKLSRVLEGINLAELKAGNQTEVYKFYEQNYRLIKSFAHSFCRKKFERYGKGIYQNAPDLMQEIYCHIHELDYSSFKQFAYSMWRVMLLFCRSELNEKRYKRLDAPVSHDNDTEQYNFVVKQEHEQPHDSDYITLNRLIDWLRRNLKPNEFVYVYYRYIKYETNDEIFKAINYSILNTDENIDRIDFRIMQDLREKYADLCNYVGGKFLEYQNTLPNAIEKRRSYMTSFSYVPTNTVQTNYVYN